MPTYDYRCPACGATKEVMHTMAECSVPSAATLAEITCCLVPVTIGPPGGPMSETKTHQVPTVMLRYLGGAPAVGKIAGMTPGQRREVLLKRSRDHYQREVKDVKHEKTVDFLKKGREKAGL